MYVNYIQVKRMQPEAIIGTSYQDDDNDGGHNDSQSLIKNVS